MAEMPPIKLTIDTEQFRDALEDAKAGLALALIHAAADIHLPTVDNIYNQGFRDGKEDQND